MKSKNMLQNFTTKGILSGVKIPLEVNNITGKPINPKKLIVKALETIFNN